MKTFILLYSQSNASGQSVSIGPMTQRSKQLFSLKSSVECRVNRYLVILSLAFSNGSRRESADRRWMGSIELNRLQRLTDSSGDCHRLVVCAAHKDMGKLPQRYRLVAALFEYSQLIGDRAVANFSGAQRAL